MIVVVRFEAKADGVDDFLRAVRQQAVDSLALEEACRRFDVAVNRDDPRQVLLYEIYDSREAFNDHLQSEHFRRFDALVVDWVAAKNVEIWDGPLV